MSTVKRWSKEEDATLKRMAGRFRAASIAKKVNRSEGSVRHRAMVLGISLRYSTRSYERTTTAMLKKTAEAMEKGGSVIAAAAILDEDPPRVRYLIKQAVKLGVMKNA